MAPTPSSPMGAPSGPIDAIMGVRGRPGAEHGIQRGHEDRDRHDEGAMARLQPAVFNGAPLLGVGAIHVGAAPLLPHRLHPTRPNHDDERVRRRASTLPRLRTTPETHAGLSQAPGGRLTFRTAGGLGGCRKTDRRVGGLGTVRVPEVGLSRGRGGVISPPPLRGRGRGRRDA
jgi:hypothetical protein